MNYYVISPNVWNDGKWASHVDFMVRNSIVCMGWDRGNKNGDAFANMSFGDCVVVARRSNWQWRVFFVGLVDGPVKYDDEAVDHFTQARDIRSIIDLRDHPTVLQFMPGMTSHGRKNPGAIFRLHNDNADDKRFITVIDELLMQAKAHLSFSVREIANWGANGRVAIPALQRGLVWDPNQVELLWDSILRGFPVGAFVFSNVTSESSQRTSLTSKDAEYFLLDGQQRSNAISLAFDTNVLKSSRVWVDLKPSISQVRRFRIKVTTIAHPWGFNNSDETGVLGVGSIRDAIHKFTKKPLSEISKFDISTLQLRDTWPILAKCPVPLSQMIKWYDLYGVDQNLYRERVLKWINSEDNPAREFSATEGIECEIDKYHKALSKLSNYRIYANCLSTDLIESEENVVGDDNTTNLENLFTRLNTMGSRISAYDLRYSAIKAYWGGIKEQNDRIACAIMPASHLAMFSFRLALTIASEADPDATSYRLADVPSVARIRKMGRAVDNTIDSEAVSIVKNELYRGRLEKIVANIEKALNVYTPEKGNAEGMPPYLRSVIISGSPDVYLFLMILSYHDFLSEESWGVFVAFSTYVHWLNIDPKKKRGTLDYLYNRLQREGYTMAVFMAAVSEIVGEYVYPLPDVQNSVGFKGENNMIASYWCNPVPADFYSRIAYNFELLIFSEREYFNRNFKYDPAQVDLIKGHNKPWDYDHIIPKDWVSNKKRGDYREVCKYWLWTIGNFAAIPFSINRSKSNEEEWDEYCENSKDLQFDNRVREVGKYLVRDKSQAELFCTLTERRLTNIYSCWRNFVCCKLGLPAAMELPQQEDDES